MGCASSKPEQISAPVVLKTDAPTVSGQIERSPSLDDASKAVEPKPVEVKPEVKLLSREEQFGVLLKTSNRPDAIHLDAFLVCPYIDDLLKSESIELVNVKGLFDIVDEDGDQYVDLKEFLEVLELVDMGTKEAAQSCGWLPPEKEVDVRLSYHSTTGSESSAKQSPGMRQPFLTNSIRLSVPINSTKMISEKKSSPSVTPPVSNSSAPVVMVTPTSTTPPIARRPPGPPTVSNKPKEVSPTKDTAAPIPTTTEPTSTLAVDTKRPLMSGNRRAPKKRLVHITSPTSSEEATSPTFNAPDFGLPHTPLAGSTKSSGSTQKAVASAAVSSILSAQLSGRKHAPMLPQMSVLAQPVETTVAGEEENDEDEDDDETIPKPPQKKGFMRSNDDYYSFSTPTSPMSPQISGTNGFDRSFSTSSASASGASSALLQSPSKGGVSNYYVLDAGKLKYMDHKSKSYKTIGLTNVKVAVNNDVIDIISTEDPVPMSDNYNCEHDNNNHDDSNDNDNNGHQSPLSINTSSKQANSNANSNSSLSSPKSPRNGINNRVSLRVKSAQDANGWRAALEEHIEYNDMKYGAAAVMRPSSAH